jgi:hypothetical protein
MVPSCRRKTATDSSSKILLNVSAYITSTLELCDSCHVDSYEQSQGDLAVAGGAVQYWLADTLAFHGV